VKEDRRHQGIASRILQEACRAARRGGVESLYIDCHVRTTPLYEKNGWEILEREVGDKDSVVMRRIIASEQSPAGDVLKAAPEE
jgi:GNAT superfamily N-acetyltransferase